MAKDPAFLFYSNDFETKTKFLTHEQVGKMIRLMITQHQHGHLTRKQVEFICGGWDGELMSKFQVDDSGLYYNDRLDKEIEKRKKYSESRRKNVSSRYKPTHVGTYVNDMKLHMENENENEIENKDIIYNIIKESDFKEIWARYPKKDGRKAALRSFKGSVRTREDLESIHKALDNYLQADTVKKGFIKNGSTWFANWEDWIEVEQKSGLDKYLVKED